MSHYALASSSGPPTVPCAQRLFAARGLDASQRPDGTAAWLSFRKPGPCSPYFTGQGACDRKNGYSVVIRLKIFKNCFKSLPYDGPRRGVILKRLYPISFTPLLSLSLISASFFLPFNYCIGEETMAPTRAAMFESRRRSDLRLPHSAPRSSQRVD